MAGAVVFYRHGRSAAPEPPLTESLLASLPGHLTHPELSPDGNQVVFAWDGGKGGLTQIYLKVVGPGEPLRLTDGAEYASAPVYSPDGTSIAFLSSIENANGVGLRTRAQNDANPVIRVVVISALGGAAREIASYKAYPRDLSWSVDGKSVLVTTEGAVYAVSVANKEQRKIVDAPLNHV